MLGLLLTQGAQSVADRSGHLFYRLVAQMRRHSLLRDIDVRLVAAVTTFDFEFEHAHRIVTRPLAVYDNIPVTSTHA